MPSNIQNALEEEMHINAKGVEKTENETVCPFIKRITRTSKKWNHKPHNAINLRSLDYMETYLKAKTISSQAEILSMNQAMKADLQKGKSSDKCIFTIWQYREGNANNVEK